MMRNKTSSSLQKTYDDCYLVCSTAVYYEGQGNEAEALRCWRSALDQIYYHNAYRVPPGYKPRSETEKALQDSLRDMEMQCKERVDLLEALKQSRQEAAMDDVTSGTSSTSTPASKLSKAPTKTAQVSSESENLEKGWIGEGTIPAVNYPDLSRPGPPLPQRPSQPRNSSERPSVGRNPSSSAAPSSSRFPTAEAPSSLIPPKKTTSRSPSPDKGRTMLTTLRSGKKSSKPARALVKTEDIVTNKAATLAWNSTSRSGRDKLGRSLDAEAGNSSASVDTTRKNSYSVPLPERPGSASHDLYYDHHTRSLINGQQNLSSPLDIIGAKGEIYTDSGRSNSYPFPNTDSGQAGAVAGPMRKSSVVNNLADNDVPAPLSDSEVMKSNPRTAPHLSQATSSTFEPVSYPSYLKEYPQTASRKAEAEARSVAPLQRKSSGKSVSEGKATSSKVSRKALANSSSPRQRDRHLDQDDARRARRKEEKKARKEETSSQSVDEETAGEVRTSKSKKKVSKRKGTEDPILADPTTPTSEESDSSPGKAAKSAWDERVAYLMKHLPRGVDESAAKQIFNEIVVQGDEVHWDDVAGLEVAKNALKEAVVYPFLRPDLFMGLREPARGMLLFGPPGTGKTMLARAVATESRSTFFSISASSLTSKYLGESEKLVRALFALAKALAPSIIFVDEIDSLLSSRSGSGEHEATRRIKTEFLIQWSDLQRAAAGREQTEKEKERGDASRVLVLAATNLPWAIDEAARRRFVRRQYIPLPEDVTRAVQLRRLLGHQKQNLDERDIQKLVSITDGFSGSDITALAKDAAMGPLRQLGEALLHMSMDDIRPIKYEDFEASLVNIRPSVSKQGLRQFEDWAREFGERGG